MSKPAARVGDLTAHGGAVAGPGCPNVLIGGQPAARLADMHACPLANGPVPHVGGPVSLGSTGVFIGGMPAARVGDMVTCTGPPDTIAPPGCPTVLIGEISPAAVVAPGVVGGAAGMSGIAAAAYTAALSSVTEEPGSE